MNKEEIEKRLAELLECSWPCASDIRALLVEVARAQRERDHGWYGHDDSTGPKAPLVTGDKS